MSLRVDLGLSYNRKRDQTEPFVYGGVGVFTPIPPQKFFLQLTDSQKQ